VQKNGQPELLVSVGKPEKIILDTYRQAGGKVADWLVKHPVRQANLDTGQIGSAELAAFCEGVLLNAFRFERYKQKDPVEPCTLMIRAADRLEEITQVVTHANQLVEAVNLERDWAHEPANRINPVTLAERAVELAGNLGIKCTILDDQQLIAMGAGAITAVGKGSQTPARMIILEYPGKGKGTGHAPVALVGKAITFDTGGYSLKDTANIQTMKYDKCGGLSVLAIIKAAVDLKLETPLVAVICAAENMISGNAYRPDDILTSLSGKTIEIVTTDAEGRLVLADGLTYVQRNFKPRAVIDMATLTGGVVTALGRVRAGMMTNDDGLAAQLSAAGDATHERLWRLPLDEDYDAQIKGDDADIKNSGGKEAHPVIGGIFLKQFVDEGTKWAHLDIAGVADVPKDLPYSQKGATGFGIRLIVKYLEDLV
jgi:leucyl aminopeptidase